jgi:uncharacterized HAD superfamily protein
MIALDIDGVVASLTDEVIFRAANEGWTINQEYIFDAPNFGWWDLSSDITPEWIEKQFNDPTFLLNAKAIEDAWYWINHVAESERVVFITHRSNDPITQSATNKWFYNWDIPCDRIYFAADKAQVCKDIKPKIFVEDFAPTASEVADNTDTPVYLINRKYNEQINGTLSKKVKKVNSLWEIEF